MIAIVDAGMGNLRSVQRALEAAADGRPLECEITGDPDRIARASRVVMPGQGAFADCASALERGGSALGEALRGSIAQGRPFLGICLGLQVLFASSDEAPGRRGLGILPGHCARFDPQQLDEDGESLRVPHVGWNRVEIERAHPAARALGLEGDWYYFVHSYFVAPEDTRVVLGRTRHGVTFASAVAFDNVLAVQFHPEKSQRAGLSLLRRWLEGDA